MKPRTRLLVGLLLHGLVAVAVFIPLWSIAYSYAPANPAVWWQVLGGTAAAAFLASTLIATILRCHAIGQCFAIAWPFAAGTLLSANDLQAFGIWLAWTFAAVMGAVAGVTFSRRISGRPAP